MTTRRAFLKASVAASAAVAGRPMTAIAQVDPSRAALVVGNEQYKQSPLDNPVNDAQAMGALLQQAAFGVDLLINAGHKAFAVSIENFGNRVTRSEIKIAVLYFAGHAVQLDWKNYLLPVDIEVRQPADIRAQGIDLAQLLSRLARVKDKTFLIILDACRDNPFGAGYRPENKGLSQFDAPPGSLIAFATAPGGVAIDGLGGKHGLYSQHLIRELSVKGARFEDALKRTRLNVRLDSKGMQIPWESTSLEADVFLFPGQKLSADDLQKRLEADMASWVRVKGSKDTEDWIRYLREFPQGSFAEIAQTRLNALLAEAEQRAIRERDERQRASAAAPIDSSKGVVVASAHRTTKPRIEIGAGLPVPDFFGGTANPYSSGTYPLGRLWTVGDEATYQELDFYSSVVQRTFISRVTLVDAEQDRVELNRGNVVLDLMGNAIKVGPRTYNVPVQFFPSELYIGKRWTAAFELTVQGVTSAAVFDLRVTSREKVNVPAGEFESFKIEGNGWNHRYGRRIVQVLWVIPRLNFVIKRERAVYAGGRIVESEREVLVSAKQHR
ncbi:MAG: caspase domain-containing protein [Burkholderiales bacterium]